MNCRTTQEQLSAYVDGELDSVASAAIEAHVASCGLCRQHLGELQRLSQGLAALPDVSVPPSFLSEVKRKLDGRASAPWWLDPRWVKVPLQAAAALSVVVLVVLLARTPSGTQRASRSAAPAQEMAKAKPAPPPIIVLEESDTTTTPRGAGDKLPVAPSAPVDNTAKQWAAADRLNEPEPLKADKLAGASMAELKPVEPLGTGPKPAASSATPPAKTLTAQTLVVVSTQPGLVQDAATQVAQRLDGLATRLQTTPDGAMSFLHVEVPAARVADFKAQFDRQYALLKDKNPNVGGRPERVVAAPSATPPEAARLRDGVAELGKEPASRSGKEGAAAAKELAYGIAGGWPATNRLPSMNTPATVSPPMVILEIQIKPPASK